jgi:hypothetical protein
MYGVLMFWNDIEEIKDWMNRLTDRLVKMDHRLDILVADKEDCGSVRQALEHVMYSDDEFNPLLKIQRTLEILESHGFLSKIDYIYENMPKIADFMQKQEKKSRQRTKRNVKKMASQASQS